MKPCANALHVSGLIALTFLGGALPAVSQGGAPPELIQYQGKLLDSNNQPQSGSFDMIFSFYDAPVSGNLLIQDAHTAADVAGPVQVTDGLYAVKLGSGQITPVGGSMAAAFARSPVFMEVSIQGQRALPRVEILSAGYSLNSRALNGRAAEFFLDSSSTAQSKSGNLTIFGVLSGNGSGLTSLDASNVSAGTLADTRLSANVTKLGPAIDLGTPEAAGTLGVVNGGTGTGPHSPRARWSSRVRVGRTPRTTPSFSGTRRTTGSASARRHRTRNSTSSARPRSRTSSSATRPAAGHST